MWYNITDYLPFTIFCTVIHFIIPQLPFYYIKALEHKKDIPSYNSAEQGKNTNEKGERKWPQWTIQTFFLHFLGLPFWVTNFPAHLMVLFVCFFFSWLLFYVEDTGHITIEHLLNWILFIVFLNLLFFVDSIVTYQMCLLHQVRAPPTPYVIDLMFIQSCRNYFEN